jgi:DNA-binding NarL/FixJ family response regulator
MDDLHVTIGSHLRRDLIRRRVPGSCLVAAGGASVTIKVLVADDQDLVRAGFCMVIDAWDDLEVVGEAGDGDQAVREAARLRPDVVLMDARMPGMNGITELARHLVLAEATVKTHVSAVLRKLGARDRVQAVVMAYDLGIVRPPALSLKSHP